MIRIRNNSFNQITMKAKGQDGTGRPVDLEMTWAFAPDLSAYNVTDGCWLTRGEWEFVESLDGDDPECGLHGDMGPGAPIYY